MKIAIVAPCHIPPSDAWVHALKAEADAHKAQVVIVDDSDGKLGKLPKEWMVFGYERQKEFLGELYDEFAKLFHKGSACRVFGHLWAYHYGYDVVLGLDSDCIVPTHFIRDHIQFLGKDYGAGWFNPVHYPFYSRGFPYSQRHWKIVANMGVWKNVLDLNGKDRVENEPTDIKLLGATVATGHFPFSGMNFALAREAIPYFLFIPNFKNIEGESFKRIDDIWGGYIFQNFMRAFHWSSMMGHPVVFHDTIVDPAADAAEEKGMYDHEDEFLAIVDKAFGDTNAEHYKKYQHVPARLWGTFDYYFKEQCGERFYAAADVMRWWVCALDKFCHAE